MQSFIRHIIYLLIPALCLVLGSCSEREEDIPVNPTGIVRQAYFTVSFGNGERNISRATPTDGTYDSGSVLENYINLEGKDFSCYLFSNDNVLVSELAITNTFKIETDANGRSYTIVAGLRPFEITAIEKGCKVAILANWGEYPKVMPGSTTIKGLCASAAARMAYSPAMASISLDNLIPMYGIKAFEAGTVELEGDTYHVGTVRMLRAFAKIEVAPVFIDFQEGANPEITSIVLTNCYDAANKTPEYQFAEDESGYVQGSWNEDYTPVNIPAKAVRIEVPLSKDETTGHYIAYVPEYDNLDIDGNVRSIDTRARLKLNFTMNGTREFMGYLDFRQNGDYLDIARNNWYKFTTTINAKEDIECVLDVIPFSSVDLRPEYGLEREPLSGYAPVKNSGGTIDHWMDKWGNNWYLGNTKGDLYATINGQKCLFVYTYPARELSHWFDGEGNLRSFDANSITNNGYTPVHISSPYWPDWYLDEQNRRVWITPYRDAGWWSPYNSQYVWILEKYWDAANNKPECWYDFLGNKHSMDEDEATVLAEWINFNN